MSYECTIGMEEYRAAVYYGAMMRNRLLFRPVVLLPLSAAYLLDVMAKLWPLYPLVLYVLGAYAVAALLLFGRAEHGILQYSRSGNSLLGERVLVRLERAQFIVDIPSREVHFSGELKKLAGVIELKMIYLAYVTAEETFLLPKRGMGEFEAAFRRDAQRALGERFVPDEEWGCKK